MMMSGRAQHPETTASSRAGLRSVWGLIVVRGLLLVLVVAPAAVVRAADLPASPDRGPRALARRWIGELSSPSFSRREHASRRLEEMGRLVIDELARAYVESSDPEKRWRLRAIARHIFFADQTTRSGFLGIAHTLVDSTMVGTLRPGEAAIYVQRVLPDTGAARAGLRVNDLILSIDGEKVPPDAPPEWFAERIRAHPPGERVRLVVLRGERRMEMVATLGTRPDDQIRGAEIERLDNLFREDWQARVAAARRELASPALPRPDGPLPLDLLRRAATSPAGPGAH